MTGHAEAGGAERTLEGIAPRFLSESGVTPGTGFGSTSGLRVHGKIFAMVVRGGLVAKLPRARVDDLVASGVGARFEPSPGRVMREWIAIPVERAAEWEGLVDEAFRFVGSGRHGPDRRSR